MQVSEGGSDIRKGHLGDEQTAAAAVVAAAQRRRGVHQSRRVPVILEKKEVEARPARTEQLKTAAFVIIGCLCVCILF